MKESNFWKVMFFSALIVIVIEVFIGAFLFAEVGKIEGNCNDFYQDYISENCGGLGFINNIKVNDSTIPIRLPNWSEGFD